MTGDALVLLVDAGLRVTVVVAAGWALTALMRRASASARHFTWMCTIVAAAAMPAASVVMPDWKVPYVTRLAVVVAKTGAAPSKAVERPAAGVSEGVAAAAPLSMTARLGRIAPSTAALAIWLVGAVGVGLYVGAGVLAARRLRRRAAAAPAPWADEGRALAATLGVSGSIALVESDTAEIPMVCGLWRPAVVMPRAAAAWPRERLHAALLHELAHVRRRDCLTQAFAQAMCALHWFNPLVWLAARRLRAERERACDDVVLEAGTRRSAYAEHLLEIARTMGSRLPMHARAGVAMAHRSQLEGRLMAILDPAIRRSTAFSTRVAAVAATLAIAVPVAAVQPQDPPDQTVHGSHVVFEGEVRIEARDVVVLHDGADSVVAGTIQWVGDKLVVHEMNPAPSAEAIHRTVDGESNKWFAFTSARGGDPAKRRQSRAVDRALVEAAADGDLQGVNDLIAAGADVNAAVEGHAGSPLIAAAREGQIEIVRRLLDAGADPNMSVPNNGNPLIAAAREGRKEVTELLLQRGAFVDQAEEGDESALTQASGAGRLETVKLLVSRGADVNRRIWVDWFEFEVTTSKDTGVVLTKRQTRDGEWRSPLSAARRGEHKAVVDYLIGAGARE